VIAPDCRASLLDATRGGRRVALSSRDYHFEQAVKDATRAFGETLATLRSVLAGTYAVPERCCEGRVPTRASTAVRMGQRGARRDD